MTDLTRPSRSPLELFDALMPRVLEELSPDHPDIERLLAHVRRQLASSQTPTPRKD